MQHPRNQRETGTGRRQNSRHHTLHDHALFLHQHRQRAAHHRYPGGVLFLLSGETRSRRGPSYCRPRHATSRAEAARLHRWRTGRPLQGLLDRADRHRHQLRSVNPARTGSRSADDRTEHVLDGARSSPGIQDRHARSRTAG